MMGLDADDAMGRVFGSVTVVISRYTGIYLELPRYPKGVRVQACMCDDATTLKLSSPNPPGSR